MPFPILMYHQIDEPAARGTPLRGLTVAPGSFARQMRLLKVLGYRGVSMPDFLPYLRGEKTGKVVGITFDDGYQNNLIHAAPILQELGFSATCYGVSQQMGGSNVWDHDQVAPKPLMTASEWRQWHALGMDVGSHTRHHVRLTELDDQHAATEICQSREELEQMLGAPVRHFCYPYGLFNNKHAEMAQMAGYESATTTQRGRANKFDDAFRLRRVMVARATHSLQFLLKTMTRYEDRKAKT
jgi:peptidoglycan/xylan/chitin deacetylase (PgdA/CDA1 family)